MTRALLLSLLSTAAFSAAAAPKPLLCTRDVREGVLKCQGATLEQATGVVYCTGGGPISTDKAAAIVRERGVGGSNPTAID